MTITTNKCSDPDCSEYGKATIPHSRHSCRCRVNIRVIDVSPPLSTRDYDWCAIDNDHYDGEPGSPVGYGRTADAAIADLMEQIEEARS